jgi:hypothetical protein
MPGAIHVRAEIQPGRRIEITSPELPEEGAVDLLIYLPESPQHDARETVPRYPAQLNAEYSELVQAQWTRELTPDEAARLHAIKEQMNALDAKSETHISSNKALESIWRQLVAIREELEALPGAVPHS